MWFIFVEVGWGGEGLALTKRKIFKHRTKTKKY